MKSLKQISTELREASEKAGKNWYDAIGGEQNVLFANQNELVTISNHRLAADKFNQLYDIVSLLDKYLQLPHENVLIRLREMIDEL